MKIVPLVVRHSRTERLCLLALPFYIRKILSKGEIDSQANNTVHFSCSLPVRWIYFTHFTRFGVSLEKKEF